MYTTKLQTHKKIPVSRALTFVLITVGGCSVL